MLIGESGPAVVISGRAAAWLERYAKLTALRVEVRGTDPEVSRVLEEIRTAALLWRGSSCGTSDAPKPELASTSEWLSTGQAATLLGVTSRAVRKSIALDRLEATLVGNQYRISREDLENYRAAKAA